MSWGVAVGRGARCVKGWGQDFAGGGSASAALQRFKSTNPLACGNTAAPPGPQNAPRPPPLRTPATADPPPKSRPLKPSKHEPPLPFHNLPLPLPRAPPLRSPYTVCVASEFAHVLALHRKQLDSFLGTASGGLASRGAVVGGASIL
jgi:hypothetical protein